MFDVFKIYKVFGKFGWYMKHLKSFNGGEYCDKRFIDYYTSNFIKLKFIVSRTP